jgi:hypothetical protein
VRRLRIHCVDAAEELPLIGRKLDQFAVLIRDARCREIEAVDEFGADRDLRRERGSAGAPTTSKERLLDKTASDRLGPKLCS